MRTMPCTPIKVNRGVSFAQSAGGSTLVALGEPLDLAQDADDADRRSRQIAKQVSAPGNALLRLYVDEHQRRLAHGGLAGAEHKIERNFDRGRPDGADGETGEEGLAGHGDFTKLHDFTRGTSPDEQIPAHS